MTTIGNNSGENLHTNEFVWSLKCYQALYRRSIDDPEGFWAEQASALTWEKTWDKVLDWNPPYGRWFKGGKLNASVQCVDRHAQSEKRHKVALYWEGETGDTRTITYNDLFIDVNRFASALKKMGIQKGDRVAIYLPMIPELITAMLACARLGAIHCVIFSGFSAQAIADRVNDSKAKLIITSSGGYRRGKILALKEIVDEAVTKCPTVEKVLLVKYTSHNPPINTEKDIWLSDILDGDGTYVKPESMDSTDPLFILYTSGTTGTPKGILHGTGGYLLYASKTMQWAFNPSQESIYWCTADAGWITGHSYLVYAPLVLGLTSVIYEGAPDFPAIDRWWQIIEKYRVNIFYTSPTAIRMFMRNGEEWVTKHDLSSVQVMGSVGEAINPEAWRWYYKYIGAENCPIVDTWWQTETGGFMISPCIGIQTYPLKPGSATFPMPGVDPVVLDSNGQEAGLNKTGVIAIRKPWPGMLLDVYQNAELYQKTYWSRFPGYYAPGDFSMKDDDGYWWLLGRADEVIKVSGHRISTAELEHAIVGHNAVAEAAATAKPDEVKGEAIVLFVILHAGSVGSTDQKKEIIKYMRTAIGTVATPDDVIFVDKLPKTRSGKIMRRVLKAVASGTPIGDVTTLDDQTSVEEVIAAYEELKAATTKSLQG
ncbi:MAG: acetate--CoA ligase [Dehalococcoidia bacterium]|nr:acetate--CoA ligase [Dehalococcoidia bacterium]